ncbi:hypothetical protein H310_09815 [Aphanomyces invadans]|uniref:Uncharacterized protein n=1 Tax=Aphanomyces invadans TaxID=157072 RepID=A0A024TTM8_9STRA|nr:hypothetical protein H310_09815 [Aphanomyces invadans]ETV96961.1 hypothetical protein H310_09815 [Aphanomyces invadans]|eukprot:XP_008874207.1 hypothetical protein H310_09815 [Aphanomyces invadans]
MSSATISARTVANSGAHDGTCGMYCRTNATDISVQGTHALTWLGSHWQMAIALYDEAVVRPAKITAAIMLSRVGCDKNDLFESVHSSSYVKTVTMHNVSTCDVVMSPHSGLPPYDTISGRCHVGTIGVSKSGGVIFMYAACVALRAALAAASAFGGTAIADRNVSRIVRTATFADAGTGT